jgi:cytochrome c oxidase cbb3-type subunit 3
MDAEWRYGGDPAQVFQSIAQGRPNGMPSFGGHIPEDQVWQIVAYVRSP